MNGSELRVIRVRRGQIQPGGSWLYVWLDVDSGEIAFVGGTPFEPELRAHLHLTSDVADVGRVRATVPSYDDRDFDVLAFALPTSIDRAQAKQALSARLDGADEGAHGSSLELSALLDAIVRTVRAYEG